MALASVTQEELRSRLESTSTLVLDARRQADWEASSLKIRGAIRLHPDEVRSLCQHLPKETEVVAYCCSEKEEALQQLVQKLRDHGFEKVYSLTGGYQDWLRAGFEMEPK